MFRIYEKINCNEVYFIAEVSANHGGKKENVLEIVRQAASIGVDCIKLQTYTADSLTIDCDNKYFRIKGGLWNGRNLYELYQEAGMPYQWHSDIKKECEKYGIDFFSTPFDKKAVDFLENLGVEAYKIASFELVDIPLIEYTASKGKPMVISTGMGSVEEIQDAVDACRRAGNEQIVLMKCCSEYPALWEDMRLGNIPDMKKRFSLPVGLSDHSLGSIGAVVGAVLGASVVEKHVMLKGTVSADSAFSMTIEEYASMMEDVKNARKASAGPDYRLTEEERKQTIFRRSIFAIKDIGVGEKYTRENIGVIRPGYGIAPKYFNDLLGKKSNRAIGFGEPIREQDLQGVKYLTE